MSEQQVNRGVIDQLTVRINRKTIQGGLTNEEFGNNLNDWRLQHHIPTRYVCIWKRYRELGRDAKFSDIISKECDNKAEGKKMTGGVTLCPSRDTGANRSFNNDNLCSCFDTNSHYYLYDRCNITDTTLDFTILWVPINTIRDWYDRCGSNGKITGPRLGTLLREYTFNDTFIDRSNL